MKNIIKCKNCGAIYGDLITIADTNKKAIIKTGKCMMCRDRLEADNGTESK